MIKYLRLIRAETGIFWILPLILSFPLIDAASSLQSELVYASFSITPLLSLVLNRIFQATPFETTSSNGNSTSPANPLEFYFSVAIKRTTVFWTKAFLYLVLCSFPAIIALGIAITQSSWKFLPTSHVSTALTALLLSLIVSAFFQVVFSLLPETIPATIFAIILFPVMILAGTLGLEIATQSTDSPSEYLLAFINHHPILVSGALVVVLAATELFCCHRFVRKEIL